MGRRDLQKSIRREFCSWRIRTRVGIGREFSDFEQANGDGTMFSWTNIGVNIPWFISAEIGLRFNKSWTNY